MHDGFEAVAASRSTNRMVHPIYGMSGNAVAHRTEQPQSGKVGHGQPCRSGVKRTAVRVLARLMAALCITCSGTV